MAALENASESLPSLDLGFSDERVISSDDYYTPKWIFDTMGLTFDLDPAQPVGGCPWIPAKNYYTIYDDGLAQPWNGRVWLNPPFSKPGEFVKRFLEHKNGIILLAVSRSKGFDQIWKGVDAITMLPSNLKFKKPDGKEAGIYMPTCLAAIGADNVKAISKIGRVR